MALADKLIGGVERQQDVTDRFSKSKLLNEERDFRMQQIAGASARQPLQDEVATQQLEQMSGELKDLKAERNQNNLDKSFKTYSETGNMKHLGEYMKSKGSTDVFGDIAAFRPAGDIDLDKHGAQIMQDAGVSENFFTDEDGKPLSSEARKKAMQDVMTGGGYAIATRPNGEEFVVPVEDLAIQSNYYERQDERELNKMYDRAKKLNEITKGSLVKPKTAVEIGHEAYVQYAATEKAAGRTPQNELAWTAQQKAVNTSKPDFNKEAYDAAGGLEGTGKSFTRWVADEKNVPKAGKAEGESGFEFNKSIGLHEPGFRVTADMKVRADKIETAKARSIYKKEIKQINDSLLAYNKGKGLRTLLEDPKLDTGWKPDIVAGVTKLLTSDMYDGLSEEDKATHLLKVTADTKAGSLLADYMKSISGSAVAEAEAKRLTRIFNAGSYANKASYDTAVKEFIDGIKTSAVDRAKLYAKDIPLTSLQLIEKVQPKLSIKDRIKEINSES